MMLGGFVDLCGFVAAAMTLITFAQRTMLPMRVTALLANVFFILYGWLGPFYPVLILHVILLPVNTIRLRQIGRGSGTLNGATPMPLIDEWRAARECAALAQAGPISGGLFVDFEPLTRLVRRRSQPSDGRVQSPQNARMDAVD